MAGAKYQIDVDDSVAIAKIKAMQAAAADLTPLHARIGAALVSEVEIGFASSQSPYGQPWKPLKIRQGQPLRNTRDFLGSITSLPDQAGVTVGTNKKYAAVHQFGATIKPKKAGGFLKFEGPNGPIFTRQVTIPARPFLPLTPDGATNLPPEWQKTVVGRIRAHFVLAAKG